MMTFNQCSVYELYKCLLSSYYVLDTGGKVLASVWKVMLLTDTRCWDRADWGQLGCLDGFGLRVSDLADRDGEGQL